MKFKIPGKVEQPKIIGYSNHTYSKVVSYHQDIRRGILCIDKGGATLKVPSVCPPINSYDWITNTYPFPVSSSLPPRLLIKVSLTEGCTSNLRLVSSRIACVAIVQVQDYSPGFHECFWISAKFKLPLFHLPTCFQI